MIVIAFPEVAGIVDSRKLDDYAARRGWSGYICFVEDPTHGHAVPFGGVSTSARTLIDLYGQKEFADADPVRCWMRENGRPVIWTVAEFRKSGNRRQRELFSLVADEGFHSGVSIPLFGPSSIRGSLVALDAAERIDVDRAIDEIKESAPLANSLISCACHYAPKHQGAPVLTARETECLKWVALGKTSWEISLILAISPRTVDFHVQNAMAKLDASSRQQAIYNAMSLGVLASATPPSPPS